MIAQIYKTDDVQVNQGGGAYYKTANFYIRTYELDLDAYVPTNGNGAVAIYQKRTVYNGSTIGTPEQFSVTLYNDPILIFPNTQQYKSHGAINYDLEQVFEIVSFTPPCDISGSVAHTDETAPFANDGTVTFSVTSSYAPIQYTKDLINFQSSPVFTGLSPGSYTVQARDANGCRFGRTIVIDAFPLPNDKQYVVQYNSIKDGKAVELRIFPPNATGELETVYIDGEVTKKYQNDDDDKYGNIRSASLNITLTYDGVTFDPNIFEVATERQFKVELLYDGLLDFQGWLLSDQVSEPYLDPPFNIQLVATDGLSSLKGQDFGGLNNERLFGITSVLNVFKYIFSRLGYDYLETTLISSLKCVQASNLSGQWNNLSVWAEMFYDSEGTPNDCYTALQKILGKHLVCYQHKGSFILQHQNDVILDDVTPYTLNVAPEFASVSSGIKLPAQQVISLQTENKPANANQTLFRKSAFSILESNAEFNLLALLYPDPGFEYSTVGNIPFDWVKVGSINATVSNTQAFEGVNSLLVSDTVSSVTGTNHDYIYYSFIIDQTNKKLNLQFKWLPVQRSDNKMPAPVFQIFLDGVDGKFYQYTPPFTSPADSWVEIPSSRGSEIGDNPQSMPEDYIAWNDYLKTTAVLPTTGTVHIVIKHPSYFFTGGSYTPTGNYTYYLDNLNLTVSDADDAYNLQLSETHRFNNLGNYNFAPKDTYDFDLFTYAENKRVAGNLFYGLSYASAQISNQMWKFLSFPSDPNDRYPAAVTRAIIRGLKQPYYIFEGDIFSDDIDFFTVFLIDQLPGRKFIPISMDIDYRNSIRRVTLAEHNNAGANASYAYIPKYQKSARKNE